MFQSILISVCLPHRVLLLVLASPLLPSPCLTPIFSIRVTTCKIDSGFKMVGESSMGGSERNESSLLSTLPKALPLEFFTEITSGYSKDRILCASAFRTFYMGILQNGLVVCVKKLAENLQIPAGKQFDNEAINLLVAQHENIVKLLGFCRQITKKVVEHNARFILVDKDECVLCYEHVPRGSLRDYLSDEANKMDWDTHFKIIKGICQGVHFLHEGEHGRIVHMDLQPDNILLDDNMVPKIADFGLSRFFNHEQSRLYTINVAGLNGYMAPEYLYRGEISWQCDIYSLGVLIIEITTREKNCCDDKDKSGREYISNKLDRSAHNLQVHVSRCGSPSASESMH